MTATAHVAASLFDGQTLRRGVALVVDGGQITAVTALADLPPGMPRKDHGADTLAPGFVDLQVNGGGGVMLNDAPGPATLATMAEAHARLGATAILPTLITDTAAQTAAAIDAATRAIAAGQSGIAGLHLEGPHLSPARKGAHDAALIRPMEAADLALLCAAARTLPTLLLTVAPEVVTPDHIAALTEAGAVVSLGHSNADYATCCAATKAGARMVTHLFNAMSPLASRAPGLVGAALDQGGLSAGLIADAIHVHPATIAAALRAKRGPGEVFLVTDAMATAGSAIDQFTLNGRRISRRDGRLTLDDGTLAGADLDMARALQVMTGPVGIGLEKALRMATSAPAQVIGRGDLGHLRPGSAADFVLLASDLNLRQVWRSGNPVI